MLFFVIGIPGRFAEDCGTLTAALVRQKLGAAESTSGNTLEDIARIALSRGTGFAVVAARYPGGRVIRALTEAGRPFLVVLDDLRSGLAYLVCRQELSLAAAVQTLASGCASIVCCAAMPQALVLRAEPAREDWAATGVTIAHHLQLDVSQREIADVVRCAVASSDRETLDASAWWHGLDKSERAIAGGALDAYRDLATTRSPGTITWASELFFTGDRPQQRVTGEIDITGRGRCLLSGPRILLPPATWSLTAALDISPDAAEHGFVLEASAGAALSRTVIRPGAGGLVEANLSIALAELSDEPVELRLYNERPAFGGHVSLHHVTAVPQRAAGEGVPEIG
jgi:hypothetical protein